MNEKQTTSVESKKLQEKPVKPHGNPAKEVATQLKDKVTGKEKQPASQPLIDNITAQMALRKMDLLPGDSNHPGTICSPIV